MVSYTQPEIQNLATHFREAAETLDRKDWGVPWERHPRGSCDVAHQTLAKIIHDRFGVSPNVVPGKKYNPNESHVWLELDGLIVDVTVDERGATVTRDHSREAAPSPANWTRVRPGSLSSARAICNRLQRHRAAPFSRR